MWLLWPAQRNEFVLPCTGWVSVLLCKNAKDYHLSLSWISLSCSLCWNFDLYYFLTELKNSLICAVQLVGVWGTDLNVVDELLVDGGMVWFEVVEKIGIDVKVLVHWLWAGSDMCHSNLLARRLHCRGKEFSAPHYFFKVLFFLIVTLSAVHLPQSIWPVQFSATCHQCVLRSFWMDSGKIQYRILGWHWFWNIWGYGLHSYLIHQEPWVHQMSEELSQGPATWQVFHSPLSYCHACVHSYMHQGFELDALGHHWLYALLGLGFWPAHSTYIRAFSLWIRLCHWDP